MAPTAAPMPHPKIGALVKMKALANWDAKLKKKASASYVLKHGIWISGNVVGRFHTHNALHPTEFFQLKWDSEKIANGHMTKKAQQRLPRQWLSSEVAWGMHCHDVVGQQVYQGEGRLGVVQTVIPARMTHRGGVEYEVQYGNELERLTWPQLEAGLKEYRKRHPRQTQSSDEASSASSAASSAAVAHSPPPRKRRRTTPKWTPAPVYTSHESRTRIENKEEDEPSSDSVSAAGKVPASTVKNKSTTTITTTTTAAAAAAAAAAITTTLCKNQPPCPPPTVTPPRTPKAVSMPRPALSVKQSAIDSKKKTAARELFPNGTFESDATAEIQSDDSIFDRDNESEDESDDDSNFVLETAGEVDGSYDDDD